MGAPAGGAGPVLDARWIGKGGTGTFTSALLDGFGELRPPGWTVWGPASVAPRVWAGADFARCEVDPAAWFGQRAAGRVPPASLVLHPHQTRPVHRRPAATCVLDLIQLDQPSAVLRGAMAARLRRSIAAAHVLFTISEEVRAELAARYAVAADDVTVLRLPVDGRAAGRVAARRPRLGAAPLRTRAGLAVAPYLVAVGRCAPHKNHSRLVDAFGRTRFAAHGGRLHLVGTTGEELAAAQVHLTPAVVVRGVLSPAELEDELAGATGLVQPSLREGFGLPVAEALLAGVPVASSPVPAIVEAGPTGVPTFDPRSVAAIAHAIDLVADLVDHHRYWEVVDRDRWVAQLPTPTTLARQVLDRLDRTGAGALRPATGRSTSGRRPASPVR